MSCNPAQRTRDQEDARTSLLQFFSSTAMSDETIKRALAIFELPAKVKAAPPHDINATRPGRRPALR
jgi:hypothetical protein